jgi:hypothetical protein
MASSAVTLDFGGEERPFALPIGRLRAVQEKVDCGPMELLRRYATGEWRVDDVREVLLQGLVGGGMDGPAATSLMRRHFDDLPLKPFVLLAQAVVMAVVVGVEDEPLGELEGEAAALSPSPGESSASPSSTEAAPSAD